MRDVRVRSGCGASFAIPSEHDDLCGPKIVSVHSNSPQSSRVSKLVIMSFPTTVVEDQLTMISHAPKVTLHELVGDIVDDLVEFDPILAEAMEHAQVGMARQTEDTQVSSIC